MSRILGARNLTTNYEVQIRKPLDARTIVPTFADLLDVNNWYKTGTTSIIAYNGLPVAVVDTADTTKNGLYILFDPACTAAFMSPDVTNEANWLKIGESGDISGFAERLNTIEEAVADLEVRLAAVEATAPEVFGYRSSFPAEGVAGKLYIATDTEKTYVWVNNAYLCVGDDTESYEVIDGGDASNGDSEN